MREKGHWGKFYCPNCHHNFREKVYLRKDKQYLRTLSIDEREESIEWEDHVHCSRCGQYISYADMIK